MVLSAAKSSWGMDLVEPFFRTIIRDLASLRKIVVGDRKAYEELEIAGSFYIWLVFHPWCRAVVHDKREQATKTVRYLDMAACTTGVSADGLFVFRAPSLASDRFPFSKQRFPSSDMHGYEVLWRQCAICLPS